MTTFDSTPGDTWCMVAYSEHTDTFKTQWHKTWGDRCINFTQNTYGDIFNT